MTNSVSSDLQNKLCDWTDWDLAAYYLANQIGILQVEEENFVNHKYLFWTDNLVGNTLHQMLNQLELIKVLEKREDPDIQYRWNKDFSLNATN